MTENEDSPAHQALGNSALLGVGMQSRLLLISQALIPYS